MREAHDTPLGGEGARRAARRAAVEHGLRPLVSSQGDPTWSLEERMAHHGVPGVSIAVIRDFRIDWHAGYGSANRKAGTPVDAMTRFQAASVSKPVTAFAALRMVADGRLDLTSDVNDQCVTWKVGDNAFTAEQPVTLGHLLSHTAGMTVHGFPGYAAGEEVPTLVQVLDGTGPAHTDPVRVDQVPGQGWRYSGGGYTVVQQLMIDAAGMPFPDLMRDLVLEPLGMTASTFANPLPADQLGHAAAGVRADGSDVPGLRHTYPEMAAAGLWTTAKDLALFAIGVQRAVKGQSLLLSGEAACRMLTPVARGCALGFSILQRGGAVLFEHGGRNEGFLAELIASRDGGYGAVVMVNSNRGDLIREVVQAVAHAYGWDGHETGSSTVFLDTGLGPGEDRCP